MKKPLFSTIYFLTLMSAGLTIHQAFAGRSPSVEPLTEISIEENRPANAQGGFDFAVKPSPKMTETKRVPANITSKPTEHSSPYSYVGPMIFLFALPIALWIVVAKKMKSTSEAPDKVGYYPKTFQFKPFRTDYQRQDEEEDDQDYPKAS
ncbi:MAG: hypothetical protein ACXVLQ_13095 [Bacteriovorax sp.]